MESAVYSHKFTGFAGIDEKVFVSAGFGSDSKETGIAESTVCAGTKFSKISGCAEKTV